MENQVSKVIALNDEKYWNNKYIKAKEDNSTPPWEAKEVFHLLKDFFNKEGVYDKIFNFEKDKKLKILEVGCGASKSCIYLSELGHEVTGIDFSSEAIKRAKEFDTKSSVNWIVGDLLNDNFFEDYKIEKESFDFILDMQCYHCLRLINEDKYLSLLNNMLKRDGIIMLVVGAFVEPYYNGRINDKIYNQFGPNLLEIDDFLIPFCNIGFTIKSVKLSKFNESESSKFPCWVSVFKK